VQEIPFTAADRAAALTAIATIKSLPAEPATPSADAVEAATKLISIGKGVHAYFVKQGDAFVSEAIKSAESEVGKWAMRTPALLFLAELLTKLGQAVITWVASLPH